MQIRFRRSSWSAAALVTIATLTPSCKTPDAPETTTVKSDDAPVTIPSVPGDPADATATTQSAPASAAVAYWVEGKVVNRATCSGDASSQIKLTKVDKTGCKVIGSMSIDKFKQGFTAAYLKSTGKKSMTSAEKDMLDAAINAAEIDGRKLTVKQLPEGKLDDLIATYYQLIDTAMGVTSATVKQAAASDKGLSLGSGPFLSESVSVPFAPVSVSPVYVLLGTTQADRIRVQYTGPTCGATVTGVNIGQNQFNLGSLKALGGGLYASNFAGHALQINYIQVIASQTSFNYGICTLQASVELGGGGGGGTNTTGGGTTTVSGYDFNGFRTCQGLPANGACQLNADPVTDACINAGGQTRFCGDCSVLCNIVVAGGSTGGGNTGGGGGNNWTPIGVISYNGGYVPSVTLPLLAPQFVKRVRVDPPTQCPGAQLLFVRVSPPLFQPNLAPTQNESSNTWKPNGGQGAVISSVSLSLNGPFLFGLCQIPIYVQ